MAKTIKIAFLLLLIMFHLSEAQGNPPDGNKTINIKMGYSSVMLQDAKPADAKAAIYVWVEVLKKNILAKYNRKSELEPYIYYSLKDMEDALNKNEVDVLGLTTTQYFELKEKYKLNPALVGTSDESIYTEYILLTRSDSGIKNISDLKGKILAQPKDDYHPLINVWLYSLLKDIKKYEKDSFFSRVKYDDKEANAAYSVYFKKADCAIIQKNVYSTICSLNPQFKNSLNIMAESPGLITSLTAIRTNADPDVVDIFYKAAKNVQLTAEGRNIIKLFRAKKLVEVTDNDFAITRKLIDDYNRHNKR